MSDIFQKRLDAIIEEAKSSNPYQVDWDSNKWCLGSNKKRHKEKRNSNLYFSRSVRDNNKTRISFEENFGNFAKSIIALRGFQKKVDIHAQRLFSSVLAHLYETMLRAGVVEPSKLTCKHFHDTAIRLSHDVSVFTIYKYSCYLEEISKFLDANQLTAAPTKFKNTIVRPPAYDGLDEESQAKGLKKMPAPEALRALAEISNSPIDDDERILLRVIDLLAVGGFRAGEVLTIPLNCWVEEEGYVQNNGSPNSTDKRTSKRCGLRYYPLKGGEPIVKWLPDCAVPLAKRAVDDLTVLCAEARNIAAVLEKNPTKLPMFDGFDPDHLLTVKELAELLSFKINTINNYLVFTLKIKPIKKPNDKKTSYFRVGDVEEKIIARQTPFEICLFPDGRKQMLSESLCVMFLYQFTQSRSTSKFQPQIIDYRQLTIALTGAQGCHSIFSRRGLTMPDGSPMKIRSHSFRHWVNTLADRGGLSDLELALWMGRKDIGQNAVYKHGTVAERQKWAEKALKEGVLQGDLADFYETISDPVEKQIFIETYMNIVHFTPFGVCLHDFAIEPCQYHLNCLRGCGDYMRTKGDQEERRNLTELRDFTLRELEKAKTAMAEDEYGANNWVAHNERIVEGCNAALAVDDESELGKAIRVFSAEITGEEEAPAE